MGIPLTSIKLRVTDYARVSTDHVEQQKSLQNQVEHFDKYIKENPNWSYVQGYVDDGITGTSDIKRDQFMSMINDAREGKFDLIVTKEISRFSRNTLDSIKYTRELLTYGVAVLFINDNINTALPDSELRLTIMASMAQDEVRRLSERVKFGMHRAIERGEILGNDMCYGYKKDKNTKHLIVIQKEANIVRRIYELYAIKELSLSKIAKLLNNSQLKTSRGCKWSVSTISRMISNPKYKGYYCGKKSEIIDYMTKKIKYFKEDDWIIYESKKKIPPIVDEDLWKLANIRLNSRKHSFTKPISKNRYLYSARIYCKKHYTVFHRRCFRRHNKDITWVCSEYLKYGKNKCDSPNIRESELDYIMKDIIAKLNIDNQSIIDILAHYYRNITPNNDFNNIINKKQKQIDYINIKKDKLLELSITGNLSNEEFYKRNNQLNSDIIQIEKELHSLKLNNKKLINQNYQKEIYQLLLSKIQTQTIIKKLISKLLNNIIVSKVDNNKIELTISLNYPINKQEPFMIKKYKFKRGYDTRGTKRYEVMYKVYCYYGNKNNHLVLPHNQSNDK